MGQTRLALAILKGRVADGVREVCLEQRSLRDFDNIMLDVETSVLAKKMHLNQLNQNESEYLQS